jgi:hypothetical protein
LNPRRRCDSRRGEQAQAHQSEWRANTSHHRHSNTETLRRLLQRQRQSAQIQADDQAVLLAGERQHGAFLVGEDDGLRALDGGCAGAALGVDTVDVGRAADIGDGAMEVRLRGAEGEAVTQPPDRQRIAAALEREHTLAGRTPDDEPGLEDTDADRAAVGVRNRHRAEQRRNGEEAGSQSRQDLHRKFSLTAKAPQRMDDSIVYLGAMTGTMARGMPSADVCHPYRAV